MGTVSTRDQRSSSVRPSPSSSSPLQLSQTPFPPLLDEEDADEDVPAPELELLPMALVEARLLEATPLLELPAMTLEERLLLAVLEPPDVRLLLPMSEDPDTLVPPAALIPLEPVPPLEDAPPPLSTHTWSALQRWVWGHSASVVQPRTQRWDAGSQR